VGSDGAGGVAVAREGDSAEAVSVAEDALAPLGGAAPRELETLKTWVVGDADAARAVVFSVEVCGFGDECCEDGTLPGCGRDGAWHKCPHSFGGMELEVCADVPVFEA